MNDTNPTYAGFFLRVLAFAYDYLIIAIYLALQVALGLLVNTAFPEVARSLFGNPLSGQAIGFLTETMPDSLYFILLESSAFQATWGKRKKNIKVVNPAGQRLSLSRSILRTLLKFIPWELSHMLIWQISAAPQTPSPLITAGFILVWILLGANAANLMLSRRHQAFYDRLAGTFVIPSKNNIRG